MIIRDTDLLTLDSQQGYTGHSFQDKHVCTAYSCGRPTAHSYSQQLGCQYHFKNKHDKALNAQLKKGAQNIWFSESTWVLSINEGIR